MKWILFEFLLGFVGFILVLIIDNHISGMIVYVIGVLVGCVNLLLEARRKEKGIKVEIEYAKEISFRPRGIGGGSGLCFVCGSQTNGADIAAFVKSKEDGEAVVKMFEEVGSTTRLDWRPSEPNWIQIKTCACKKHEPNLEKLLKVTDEFNTITKAKIRFAKESK